MRRTRAAGKHRVDRRDPADRHPFAPDGSTGEDHTMTRDELRRGVSVAPEEVGDKHPVVASIIVNITRQAVLSARDMIGTGVKSL